MILLQKSVVGKTLLLRDQGHILNKSALLHGEFTTVGAEKYSLVIDKFTGNGSNDSLSRQQFSFMD